MKKIVIENGFKLIPNNNVVLTNAHANINL